MKKMKAFLKHHWDLVLYLLIGVLTTALNFVIYLPCHNLLGISAAVSNGIAWVVVVIFAFLTNKPFVFHSYDWSIKTVLPEFGKFIGCRVGSGVAETLILLLTVDLLHWDGNIMKLLTSIMVVILNYVGSKLLVFKH